MKRTDADYSVYLVTDRPLCMGRDILDVVRAAVRGGATVVQLREKHASSREFVELARAVKAVLSGAGVPLIINDRLDVALAADAEGVHVGQSDMSASDVRRILGPHRIVGLSVENLEHVREAAGLDVDYLGIGPVYPTATKPDAAPPLGLQGVREARAVSRHPLVGIGAVDAANAADVIRAGADGVAVVSAICAADSPEDGARRLARAVRSAREALSICNLTS